MADANHPSAPDPYRPYDRSPYDRSPYDGPPHGPDPDGDPYSSAFALAPSEPVAPPLPGTPPAAGEPGRPVARRGLMLSLAGAGGVAVAGAAFGAAAAVEHPGLLPAAKSVQGTLAHPKPGSAGRKIPRRVPTSGAGSILAGRGHVDLDAAAGGQGGTPKKATRNHPAAAPAGASTGVAHLLRRATFGFNRGELARARKMGAHAWLEQQLAPKKIADPVADRLWKAFPKANDSITALHHNMPLYSWDAMFALGQATLARQLFSRRHLYEVMVDFWANHLNVTIPSDTAWDNGPSYHNHVIRTHALGSFEKMLLAAMRHPGMLRFLSNDQSQKAAVNENLGRELLELHTVGLEADYTEKDVRNSAYILTGRTASWPEGLFKYEPSWHWTGKVKVLGHHATNTSADGGLKTGDAYLRYLARHPMTARHIARKLAIRFVSDSPSEKLVAALAKTYLKHGTEIKPVLRQLFHSKAFAHSVGEKSRRPLENVAAAVRAANIRTTPTADAVTGLGWLYWDMTALGHAPLAWPAPNGYPDVAAAWQSPGAVVGLWNVHRKLLLGSYKGLTPASTKTLGQHAKTVGGYVDGLADHLTGQKLRAKHRDALLAFSGHKASTKVSALTAGQLDVQLAALVLGSPYVAVR